MKIEITFTLHRIYLLVGMFFLASCLWACTGKRTIENEKNKKGAEPVASKDIQTNVDSNGKLYKELDKNLFVDARVDLPGKTAYTEYKAKCKIFKINELSRIFLKENSSKPKVTRRKEDSNSFIIATESGAEISSRPGSFWFFSRPSRDDEILGLMETCINSEDKETAKNQNLKFSTRKKAIEQGMKLLKKLNIACLTDIKADVNTVTVDQLKNCQKKMLKDEGYKKWVKLGKTKIIKDWSSDDNYYILKFTLGQDGLSVYNTAQEPRQSLAEDWPLLSMSVQILLSPKGIIYASGDNLLSVLDIKSQSKPKPILSIDDALVKLKGKYEDVILTDKNTISKIWMEYIPIFKSTKIDTCILRPYWCFQIERMLNHRGIKKVVSIAERFNAFSGGDLTYGK